MKELEYIIKLEGGYVDHPNDPGGETKYGISRRSFPNVDIANLTKKQAMDIYYDVYFEDQRLKLLPPSGVRFKLFSMCVHMGTRRAVKFLQLILNDLHVWSPLKIDGMMGPQTARAVESALYALYEGDEVLVWLLSSHQGSYYSDIIRKRPSLKVFEKGWNSRIKKENKYALEFIARRTENSGK